jgi:hypothetical protein
MSSTSSGSLGAAVVAAARACSRAVIRSLVPIAAVVSCCRSGCGLAFDGKFAALAAGLVAAGGVGGAAAAGGARPSLWSRARCCRMMRCISDSSMF